MRRSMTGKRRWSPVPFTMAAGLVWVGMLVGTTHATEGERAPSLGGGVAGTQGAGAHETPHLFAHSQDCLACHNNLATPSGEDVSIGASWRSTMMANSARDPYWQASVRRETLDHRAHQLDIEDECSACHMPMPQRVARAEGRKGEVFSFLPFSDHHTSDAERLAADGISCTVCHQIAPDRLGTRESFNANFVVKPTPPGAARIIFGPYAIDAGRKAIMRSVTGYEQAEGLHIQQSELCASCHTLITEAFGPDGKVVGSLPEQMNYQEWQHSDFAREKRSCQSCHMPRANGPIRIASVLGDERDTLARHVFVGGNAHMVRLLNRFRTELSVTASPGELEATADATIRQLQRETAEVRISEASLAAGRLAFDVDVRNLSGHKFPTGYPSRRTWLHVSVADPEGRVVFESGAIDATGAIRGNDADADGARFEPHHQRITSAEQVQIYEAILGDPSGGPTTGLLRATRYLKDNRLLPRGFDKGSATADIAVFGEASTDDDFRGQGDRVRYDIEVPAAATYHVRAELRYQSIGFRWARNLSAYDAVEPRAFVRYYDQTAADSSVDVAVAEARVTNAGQGGNQ